MARLTEKQIAFVQEPNYAVVATVDGSGRPQTTVVWVDTDGTDILFNTTTKRAKARNLATNPSVSVLVIDRETPHRWVEFAGPVDTTEEGAADHINRLSNKYYGHDFDRLNDRLIVRLHPQRITEYEL